MGPWKHTRMGRVEELIVQVQKRTALDPVHAIIVHNTVNSIGIVNLQFRTWFGIPPTPGRQIDALLRVGHAPSAGWFATITAMVLVSTRCTCGRGPARSVLCSAWWSGGCGRAGHDGCSGRWKIRKIYQVLPEASRVGLKNRMGWQHRRARSQRSRG